VNTPDNEDLSAAITAKRSRGRPTNFNRTTAINAAMKLFWEYGYEGTTFEDLIRAMGISASTFYNSFGSKEQLYREATQAYLQQSSGWFLGILHAATDSRTAFQRLLEATAVEFTRDHLPHGCMVSLAGTHAPASLQSVRELMTEHRATAEKAMAQRLRKGISDGDLPPDTDVTALAAFYSALSRGLAVQARDGASPEKLLSIARTAMQAWPGR
jgi:AcrR family transcriptional regulator